MLELPHRGDSTEKTQYAIFNMNNKNTLNYPQSAATVFFQGTQERVRNSRVKQDRSKQKRQDKIRLLLPKTAV